MPDVLRGPRRGAIGIDAIESPREWSSGDRRRLRLLGEVLAHEVVRKRAALLRERDAREIRKLKEQLEAENKYLRRDIEPRRDGLAVVAESDAMKEVLRLAEQVAATDATVLLRGETGVGKEVVARAIHRMSTRRDRPLIGLSCVALSPSLIESELFGRERGACTGAIARQAADSRSPMGPRSSWTRWASCPSTRRPSCSACCRPESSSAWAAPRPAAPTCASSRPRTRISKRPSEQGPSAATSSTASACFP